jgi:nitrous oxide reductase accessory protein NosL
MFFKKFYFYVLIILFGTLNLQGAKFSKQATIKPTLIQQGKSKHWCPICGMSIKKFYKTSHGATLPNMKKRQYCSIRCLAVDMQEYNISLNDVIVVDAKTQKLINAKDAFYVVNSKVKGTMSKVSKLAFKKKKDALEFIKKYKGRLTTFDEALAMARKSLEKDIAMTLKKRQKKMYPMGKKLFAKKCPKINPLDFLQINHLKSALKQNCKPLKPKQLQAVALYLWEVKRFGILKQNKQIIQVTKDEKCPICGMFVYKYPRWAAQIFYKHNNHEHHFSFDGVKDLMKYYFKHKQNISKILVTDYYTQKAIDGTKAYYVIGSDIYGPMGNELIPFKNKNDAISFKKDHRGNKIIKFNDIKESEVYDLDLK